VNVERRRVPQQQRSGDRVDAILAAARSLLQEHDPADLSTRAVASRAGVSPATVYRYFSDMDEIVDALLVEHATIAEATVADALERSRHRTVGGVFEHIVVTYLDLYEQRPDLTTAWRSPALANRQRTIEEQSDRSLAFAVGEHLQRRGLLVRVTKRHETMLTAHWTAVGALIGVFLRADVSARPALRAELLALVGYFATRY
jgi:AcrR family transcriptional regulator